MAAYRVSQGPLIDRMQSGFDTEWIRYVTVTDNFFSLLGRSSAAGRVLTREDFSSGERVAVVTHSLWQRRFGGSADVIGKRVGLGDSMSRSSASCPTGSGSLRKPCSCG